MGCQLAQAGKTTEIAYLFHLSKVGSPLPSERVFYGTAFKAESFENCIVGMTNENLLYGEKLTIVISVSSTLPKDGFKPAPL